MPWIQVILQIPGEAAERYEDALQAAGAGAVTLMDNADQPLLEPPPGATPVWDDSRVIGLFDAAVDSDIVLAALKNSLGTSELPPCRIEALEDKDWEREWMTHYKPMKFGERLWVCPSWCEPPEPNGVNLLLDPGLAFGTGTHPTTHLCLAWLDAQHLENSLLVDYGCGSGILGVAGALLGCRQVLGVDNDPQALIASRSNAGRNGVSDTIEVFSPEAFHPVEADYVVANILAGPLIELAPNIAALLKPGGKLALSGILQEQADNVQKAYAPWIDFDPVTQKEDWVRISGTKRA